MRKFLNKEERKQLTEQHRQEKDGRTRDRIKAVLMSDTTGWTFKNIAETLLLDQETISRHVTESIRSNKSLQLTLEDLRVDYLLIKPWKS